MPIEISGVRYMSASEVARQVGVSRQTLWRWRQDGHIPPGSKYRDRQVVFTPDEVHEIKEHANRIEPIDPSDKAQLRLFGTRA